MIDALSCLIMVVLVGFMVILPVYVNIFKEQIYSYIKERMIRDENAEKLRKKMLSNKKKK